MKSFSRILLITFFLIAGASMQAGELEDILQKHFEAIGQEQLLKHNTMKLQATQIIPAAGFEMELALIFQRPNKMRIDGTFQGQAFAQAFNGSSGWKIEPWTGSTTPQDLTAEENQMTASQADFDGELYNWKEKGHHVALIGKEDLEGSDVYRIKLTRQNGDESLFFIDAEAYVIVLTRNKININGVEMESETSYANYKDVGGMIVPHKFETKIAGQTQMQMVVKAMEVDVPVEESLFSKPALKNQ